MSTKGRFTFVIDSDLEKNQQFFQFYKEIKENVDLVIGYQKNEREDCLKFSGNLAYFYLNKILKIEYQKIQRTSLMTEQFRESLLKHPEKSINYIGLLTITGSKMFL